jgi:RNA polymerase sigma-70 factor (ECF subfamily)
MRVTSAALAPVPDAELVRRVAAGDAQAFEALMRRHNGALFRVARAILASDPDAEDALQDAYLAAFLHSDSFRGESSVATWLTRIVVNQAIARRRRRTAGRVVVPMAATPEHAPAAEDLVDEAPSPEDETIRGDVRRLLERKIDALPEPFREVLMLRDIGDLSVEETAECLAIPPATVRTRLFRARARLRESLARELDLGAADVFTFDGARCDRVVAAVLSRWSAH